MKLFDFDRETIVPVKIWGSSTFGTCDTVQYAEIDGSCVYRLWTAAYDLAEMGTMRWTTFVENYFAFIRSF